MSAKLKGCFIAIMILFVLQLYGCEGHGQFKDLKKYIESLKKQEESKKNKSTIPEVQLPVPSEYHADTLRAPFETTEALAGKAGNITNPLLAYPLTMLRFVGTVSLANRTLAFVLAPDNMIYQVKEGDVMGDHNGKVINIQPDRINVMEQDVENGKPTTQHLVTLQLKEEH